MQLTIKHDVVFDQTSDPLNLNPIIRVDRKELIKLLYPNVKDEDMQHTKVIILD